MRRNLIFLATMLNGVAMAAMATPAHAADKNWYAGIEGGVMDLRPFTARGTFTSTSSINITALAPGEARLRLKHKLGFDVDAIAGYDFGMFRAEAEIGYKHASFKKAQLCVNSNSNCISGKVSGNDSALSAMGNLLFDLPLGDRFHIAVGGGAGAARVWTKS